MNLIPMFNFIVVEPIIDTEVKTAAGLYMTKAPEKVSRGKVIALGQGFRMSNGEFAPIPLKIGDKVIYGSLNPQFATALFHDGKQLLIIRDSDVFCIDTTPDEPLKQ